MTPRRFGDRIIPMMMVTKVDSLTVICYLLINFVGKFLLLPCIRSMCIRF